MQSSNPKLERLNQGDPKTDNFDGWKEIAAYLKRTVRTVQRWEKEEALPVVRHKHLKAGSVTAKKSELDAWVRSRQNGRLSSVIEPIQTSETGPSKLGFDPFMIVRSKRSAALSICAILTFTIASGYLVSRLRNEVVVTPQGLSSNAAANESYLKGKYQWHKGRFDESVRAFQKAVELDPSFVEGWEGLAIAFSISGLSATKAPRDCFPQAQRAAQQALSLNQASAESRAVLGLVKFFWEWDRKAAEQEFAKALALNRNSATVHQSYAYFLSATGKHDDAIAHARSAQELEPLSVTLKVMSGWFHYMARRYDHAVVEWRKALDLEPQVQRVQSGIVAALREQGKYEQARNEEIRYLRMIGLGQKVAEMNSPDPQQALHNFYQLRLDHLKDQKGNSYVPPGYLAQTYANLNERESLFEWLEKAFVERDVVISLLGVHPVFDAVRSDPRFQKLLLRAKENQTQI